MIHTWWRLIRGAAGCAAQGGALNPDLVLVTGDFDESWGGYARLQLALLGALLNPDLLLDAGDDGSS